MSILQQVQIMNFITTRYSQLKLASKWLGLGLISLFLAACASTYPEAIRGDEPVISFQTALEQKEQVVGQQVRWGGLLAKIENKEDHTQLEVVHLKLKKSGRPVIETNSAGRFRIQVPGFLDPELYSVGRLITVYGQFKGIEPDKIGEFSYDFPMIKSQGLHLWEQVEPSSQMDVFFHYGYGPYGYGRAYYHYPPYYTHPYYRPRPHVRPPQRGESNDSGTQPNSRPSTQEKQRVIPSRRPALTERSGQQAQK